MNMWLDSGVVTFSSISSPNAYIDSNGCSFVYISKTLSYMVFIFITKNVCFFPLETTNSKSDFQAVD